MSRLQFKQQSACVESLVQSSLQILDNYNDSGIKSLLKDFNDFWSNYQKQPKLTIAFIGQYNAGKSTMIKALTGNKSVKIDSQICTDQVTEYPWKDILIIDTPGIHAGKTDHDQLTLEKISTSDLLVFVVSNSLFNPQSGSFFKKVATDMQRVGQMVLVVNKMSCESGELEILIKSMLPVIEPYHPNDFYTCFIDADSYLKSRYEKDEEEKLYLIEESNFDAFLNSLQKLIYNNQLTVKFITPLHKTVDLLEQSCNLLATNETSARNSLEMLRREAHYLRASQIRAKNIYLDELNNLKYEIIILGEEVASMIDGYHTKEVIDAKINQVNQTIEQVIKNILETIASKISQEIDALVEKLKELEKSQLGQSIEREIAIKLQNTKESPNYDHQDFQDLSYLKAAPEMLKQVSNIASQATRNIVYDIGKGLGYKFKPWGAFKAATKIKGFAPVLAGVGFVLDFLLTAKEQKDQMNREMKIMELRENIRQDYRNLSEEIKTDYALIIEETIQFYDNQLSEIDKRRSEITNNDKSKEEIVKHINDHLTLVKDAIRKLTRLSNEEN